MRLLIYLCKRLSVLFYNYYIKRFNFLLVSTYILVGTFSCRVCLCSFKECAGSVCVTYLQLAAYEVGNTASRCSRSSWSVALRIQVC